MSFPSQVEAHVSEFDSQTYPTVEQTIINNASVLYKRKKHFLGDLRQLMNGIAMIMIGIVYLRDMSMIGFATRAFSQYSLSNPFPVTESNMMLAPTSKQVLTKFLLIVVLGSNLFIIFIHLVFGVYSKSPSPDKFLHGGATIQFVGERVPYSRWELLILDVLILFTQLVFHNLMCVTDDSEVLETKRSLVNLGDDFAVDRSEIEGDGYSGNVSLIKIHLFRDLRKILGSLVRVQFPQRGVLEATEEPQALPQSSAFV